LDRQISASIVSSGLIRVLQKITLWLAVIKFSVELKLLSKEAHYSFSHYKN